MKPSMRDLIEMGGFALTGVVFGGTVAYIVRKHQVARRIQREHPDWEYGECVWDAIMEINPNDWRKSSYAGAKQYFATRRKS